LFGHRPWADSHSSGRGGVLSPRTPTASGMVLQCPGWRCDGGDGCIGPMATERTRLTGPTSRRGPGRAQNRHPSPFKGSAVLFRGCGALAVHEWVAQCHGADTGHTAQYRTMAGVASPGGLAEQRRDLIPRRVRGTACVDLFAGVRALNAPVGGAGTGAASPWEPRARRRLARGGRPAFERSGPHPRGRPSLERGGTSPEGTASPRARRGFISAVLCTSSEAEFRSRAVRPTALVGRWGHQGRGPLPLGRDHFERVLGL
jgi:hypothetical protein